MGKCTIEFQFSVNDKIRIKSIDWPGTVTQLIQNKGHLSYSIEYWYEGVVRVVTMGEEQIELDKKQ